MKKFISFFTTVLLIFQYGIVFAGSLPMPGRVCEGSEFVDGTYIPAGQVREITYGGTRYRCVGCGGCTPISSGSSGSSSSYTSYIPYGTTSQQIAIGLMAAFISGFFGTLMNGMFNDNTSYKSQKQKEYEEQQKRLEEEKRKQEEKKKQLLSQYNSLIAQAKSQTQASQQSSSPFTFQTLGSQLTAFQWQSLSSGSASLNTQDEYLKKVSVIGNIDINSILGNVIQEKITEKIDENIDEYGGKAIEKINKKYGKDWDLKYYERGLPIIKIVVAAKTEGIPSAGAEMIDYGISLIPMPTLQSEISDTGRKIYTKIAFFALDKFLSETEKACNALGVDCNKEQFMRDFERDMNIWQKIIYKYLKGD